MANYPTAIVIQPLFQKKDRRMKNSCKHINKAESNQNILMNTMKLPQEKSCHEKFHHFGFLTQLWLLPALESSDVPAEKNCQLITVRPNLSAGATQATPTVSCLDTPHQRWNEELSSSLAHDIPPSSVLLLCSPPQSCGTYLSSSEEREVPELASHTFRSGLNNGCRITL